MLYSTEMITRRYFAKENYVPLFEGRLLKITNEHTHTHKKNKLERKTSYAGVKAKDRYCYGDVIQKIYCPISCWLSCLVILVSQTACNFLPQNWKERLEESVEQTGGSQSCTGWKQFGRPTIVSLFLKIDTNTNALESDVFSLSNLFFSLRLYCVNRVTGSLKYYFMHMYL